MRTTARRGVAGRRPRLGVAAGVLLAMAGGMAAPAAGDEDGAALRPYLAGNGLLNRGMHELAIEEYRQFLRQSPAHEKAPVARYGLGVCLFRLGKHAEAAAELAPLSGVAGFQFGAEVELLLGQSRLALGDAPSAAAALGRFMVAHGGHASAGDACALLVEALQRAGRHDEAAAVCDRLVEQWPEAALRDRAEFFGAMADMARGEAENAAERLESVLERAPEGPLATQARLMLAQCRRGTGETARAIAEFRRVAERAEGEPAAEALAALVSLLREAGDLDEAAESAERLLKEHPESARAAGAQLELGRIRFDQGRYDDAATALERAIGREGVAQDGIEYWLAKCDLRRGSFEECAARLGRAAERHPESSLRAEMRYDRAVALLRAERMEDAAGAFEDFLGEFGGHAMEARAMRALASLEHARGRFDRSLALCEEFATKHQGHELGPVMAFLAAENEFFAGRTERAAERYREVLDGGAAEPMATEAAFRLGLALHRLERLDEAEQMLARVAPGRETAGPFLTALCVRGDIAFQKEDWRGAAEMFEWFLSHGLEQQSADDALLKLGIALQRLGEHEEAIAAHERLIERFQASPHRAHAVFERAQALVALGRDAEARAALEGLMRDDPESRFASHALSHLGSIALRDGEAERAAELFERAGGAAGEGADGAMASLRRGQALLSAGKYEEAAAALQAFIDAAPEHARAPEAMAQRAIALSRAGRAEEAIAAIERAERAPGGAMDDATAGALRYEKAWRLREAGRGEEAARAYHELLEREEDAGRRAHAMVELAEIDADAGRYDAAAEALRGAVATLEGMDDAPAGLLEQAMYRLAVSEHRAERFAEAGEAFERFLAAHPESALAASAALVCGEAHFRAGRFDRAARFYGRAAEADGLSDDDAGAAMLRLGECFAALGRWEESERAFGEYVEKFGSAPLWFQAMFGVGWARENLARHDEAVEAYRAVVERHEGPTAARAQFQIGECLFAQGRFDEAARELLKVDILYAYPEWSAAALFEAGRCFEAMGRPDEARGQYERVRSAHGQTQWASMAAERLRAIGAAAAAAGQGL